MKRTILPLLFPLMTTLAYGQLIATNTHSVSRGSSPASVNATQSVVKDGSIAPSENEFSIRGSSLSLQECQKKTQGNYPLVRQYDLIEKSMHYNVANALKGYLPQFSLSGKATYQSEVTKLPIQLPNVAIKGMAKDQYQMMLEMKQNIWDGGEIRSQKRLVQATSDVDREKVNVDMYALVDRVNQIYFGILSLDEQLKQNQLLQEELVRSYRKVAAYMENGVANQADLDAVSVEQLNTRQQRVQLESSRAAYLDMLALFVGEQIAPDAVLEKPFVNDTQYFSSTPTDSGTIFNSFTRGVNSEKSSNAMSLSASTGKQNQIVAAMSKGAKDETGTAANLKNSIERETSETELQQPADTARQLEGSDGSAGGYLQGFNRSVKYQEGENKGNGTVDDTAGQSKWGAWLSPTMNNRPELTWFDAQSERLKVQDEALNTRVMPHLGLFVQGAYGNPGLNMLKNKFTPYYIAGVRLSWNFGSLYTMHNDRRLIDNSRRQLETNRDVFLFNTNLESTRQNAAIRSMRKQMVDDDEIIRLRTNIRKASEAKVANGTMTVTDMLRDITSESLAKQTKALHEIQLLMDIWQLKYTLNK